MPLVAANKIVIMMGYTLRRASPITAHMCKIRRYRTTLYTDFKILYIPLPHANLVVYISHADKKSHNSEFGH